MANKNELQIQASSLVAMNTCPKSLTIGPSTVADLWQIMRIRSNLRASGSDF